jgi:hypothetical protein
MRQFLAAAAAMVIAGSAMADDNVVIVFDNSGSMGEWMGSAKATRMKVAQDALVATLSKLPPTTNVGIVTFRGWVYDLAPADPARLESAVRGVVADGGTPLYQYIKVGADRLLQERDKKLNVGYYKLLVVTDGEAQDNGLNDSGTWKDGSYRPGYLEDIQNRGIVVDAIGLEMAGSHSLKTKINGQYMVGNDPASIVQSLQKSVAEVGFGKDGGVGDEAFQTVGELPDAFVKASLQGLTTFQNQPVGELAPIRVVNPDGSVTILPNPANSPQEGMHWAWKVLIGLGVAAVAIILLAVVSAAKSGR